MDDKVKRLNEAIKVIEEVHAELQLPLVIIGAGGIKYAHPNNRYILEAMLRWHADRLRKGINDSFEETVMNLQKMDLPPEQ